MRDLRVVRLKLKNRRADVQMGKIGNVVKP